ncbi:ricin-type beta-trefoil lectin domain protein [Streptomyces sp. NPDC059582]|uniref:RICIN domain-containing protein n=1 Tax=Streptomyces sp. NPDC059582 TaxID=3346875 RepID=UPI003675BEF8
MNEAGPMNSPGPAHPFDATDAQLSAELKRWTGASPAPHPVGELLDRHWEAAFAYARLCTSGVRAAGMLTTAAFTRLFGESLRHDGPTAAWRPRLLVTVRRIAAEWDTDGRRDLLHPALRSGSDDGDRASARLLPPAGRRLLSRAFQRLPQSGRCLLWHVEVEAEPLAAPAALLGLDEDGASVALRRGRERLREECLQLHQELAPEQECRQYLRLLDVTCRRGGGADVDPDLRRHLDRCRHCRDTADQLTTFNVGLGLALAEGVLGWGARAYVESRMAGAEATEDTDVPAVPPGTPAVPGEPFTAPRSGTGTHTGASTGAGTDTGAGTSTGPRRGSRRSAQRARAARRRNLTAAVLTVSGLIVVPLVLWSALGSGDGNTKATGGAARAEGTGASGSSTADPSWVGAAEETQDPLHGRLHNEESGLCIAVAGRKTVEGAEAELATCSSAPGQQWTYESDGLLRSVAAPGLCLDSRLGYSVRLAPCAGESEPGGRNVRYDFTLQGTLVPRSNQNLALSPAATDGSGALVLKNRGDTTAERWVIDTSEPDPQMEAVNWDADTPRAASPTPTPRKAQTPAPAPSATRATPAPTSSATTADPCALYPYACSGNGRYGEGYGNGGHGNGGYGYGGYDYGGYGGGYGDGNGSGGGRR